MQVHRTLLILTFSTSTLPPQPRMLRTLIIELCLFAEHDLPLEDQSGSKYFAAPELAMKPRPDQENSKIASRQFDEKLDSWGAGLAFYYMLHGSHPFMVRPSLSTLACLSPEDDKIMIYTVLRG